MSGLIKKDLIVMKRKFKPIQLLIILVVILPLSQNPQYALIIISLMVPFLLSILVSSSFGYDQISKWEEYAVALPLPPKKIVASKYILCLISLIISLFIVVLAFFLLRLFEVTNSGNLAMAIVVSTLFTIIYHSLMIPVIYKFGIETSHTVLYAFILIPTIISTLFGMFKMKIDVSIFDHSYFIIFVFFILFLLLFLSYLISVKIYKKNRLK
ncbi:MAG TPA: hypothetical protein DD433_10085 [Ruminococcaceae bacterium]|jgi:hypothetical protein|nr:hypothetical protein [Oscillospiraceae bacterium]